MEHHGIPHIVIIGEDELGALGQNDVVQGVLIGVVAVEPGAAIHRAGVLHRQVKGKVAAARRAGHVVDAGFDVLAHKQIQAVLAVAEGIRNIAGHRVGGSIGGQVIDLRVAAVEIERIVPAQEQHRTRGQRDVVQPRIRSVVGGQILINFHTAGIVDKVHLHGCAVLGALDRVGARGQVLPHDVQPGGQVAVPVGAPGGYERAQVVVGVAVGLYGLFFGNFGNGLGNRGTDFTMQQDLQHGQNQKQRHNDDKPRGIGTAAASGGCLDVVLHPGRAHRWARCIVAVCAALMYMGGAFLVVVAFHLGAVARGPHAVENILAVDAVIVGTLAPQGVAVLRRDGQTTVLTPAIDDPSAAQAAFLHRDTSYFAFIIQDSVGNSKRGGKIKKPPLSKGDSASGISCPFCSRLSVQLLGKNRHQYQHQQQDKGIEIHRDILRQNAEKR